MTGHRDSGYGGQPKRSRQKLERWLPQACLQVSSAEVASIVANVWGSSSGTIKEKRWMKDIEEIVEGEHWRKTVSMPRIRPLIDAY